HTKRNARLQILLCPKFFPRLALYNPQHVRQRHVAHIERDQLMMHLPRDSTPPDRAGSEQRSNSQQQVFRLHCFKYCDLNFALTFNRSVDMRDWNVTKSKQIRDEMA